MSKTSETRDAYVEKVLTMRTLADSVSEKWTKLAADSDLKAAVDSANEATGKKLKLSPSPAFIGEEKRLEALEHTVLSESIPLTNDGSSLLVGVTINGKHHTDMTVDSGSTSMLLPYAMAKEMGMEPKSSDPKVTCVLADGSEVEATRLKLDSVRVGKFTVDGVDCCVLERRAVNATPLLGMSFLGNFNFTIDKQKAELRMVKVDSGDAPGKSKAATAKSKPSKSKPGSTSKSKSRDATDE
jgi:aspartyl protease family protein